MNEPSGAFGEFDLAEFDQQQASAIEKLRTRRAFFVYVVNDDLTGDYILAAPEFQSKALPPRTLTRVLISAAREALDELEERLP